MSVLLITSLRLKRWVLPKGNSMKGLSRHASAQEEAFEEAGVRGVICDIPLGSYRYHKILNSGLARLTRVDVFALAVAEELDDWPERSQRSRRWFTQAEAAKAVDEPDLHDLLLGFRL